MRCPHCGFDNGPDYKFCGSCGAPLQSSEPKTIRLKCQDCNGVMDVDESKMIAFCPYCGSKKLILESDVVKVEKIKSQTVLGQEQIRMDRSLEEKKLKYEQDRKDAKLALIIGGLCFLLSIIMAVFGQLLS